MAKKILALLLAVMIIAALTVSAFADDAPTTGTITVTNASAGQEYKIYKVFDATYDGEAVAYTVPYSDDADSLYAAVAAATDLFVVGSKDADGNCDVSAASGAAEADIIAWLKTNSGKFGTAVKTVTPETGNTVVFDELAFGYYYITSTLGTAVTINTAAPTASVIDKNPTEPYVPDAGAKAVNETTAKVGDTVHYTVTFTATNFVTKEGTEGADPTTKQITSYVITDTAVGVKLNSDIKVTVKGTEISAATAFDTDGNLTLSWVNDSGNSIYQSPATVVITYTGVVTEGAVTNAGQATNKAVISYVTGTDTPVPVNPDEPPVTTEVYSVDITKVDSAVNTKKLDGAKFVLVKKDGQAESFYKYTAAAQTASATAEWVSSESDATVVITENGIAKFEGFAAGTYYLREIDSPKGYALPEQDFEIKTDDAASDTNRVAITVENTAGSKLPTTGGIGTTVFYVVGGILVIGAAVVLLSKKRIRG